MLHEYFGNIHIHTTYSDGIGTYEDVIAAARKVGLDFVYVTDHNVLVRRREEGYRRGILSLVGQEVHDEERVPQRDHLLCLGVEKDVSQHAKRPQAAIDATRSQGGLSFLAHPVEEYTSFLTQHFSWESWDVSGYTGVELWNYMSGFRGFVTSKLWAILVGVLPHWFTRGPVPDMLKKWDELTQKRTVVAIGGTDVHAWTYNYGPIRRCFLPYLHCAQALNTHILVDEPFVGAKKDLDMDAEAVQHDHRLVLAALRSGHCWTGYDLVGPTKGFRFSAWQVAGEDAPGTRDRPHAIMGDTLAKPGPGQVTHFVAQAPARGVICLLRNGRIVASQYGRELTYRSELPGVYRVEVWRRRWGKARGWIFSNPIYIR